MTSDAVKDREILPFRQGVLQYWGIIIVLKHAMTISYFLIDVIEIAMFVLILLENLNSFWYNRVNKVCVQRKS
jgi:bacteriorhodopsin